MASESNHPVTVRCPCCPNRSFPHAAALLQHCHDKGHNLQLHQQSDIEVDIDAQPAAAVISPLIMVTNATPDREKKPVVRGEGTGRNRKKENGMEQLMIEIINVYLANNGHSF